MTTTLWLHRFGFIKNPFEFAKKCHVEKIKIQSEAYMKPIFSKLVTWKIYKKNVHVPNILEKKNQL